MNDTTVAALLFAAIVAVVVAAMGVRIASVEQRRRALSRLEGKLDALLKHQGISFDPYLDTPQAVLDALATRQDDRSHQRVPRSDGRGPQGGERVRR